MMYVLMGSLQYNHYHTTKQQILASVGDGRPMARPRLSVARPVVVDQCSSTEWI
jgi:hypothetical protein